MANYIVNGKKVDLSDRDFKGQGGTAKIYIKGNKVYKIFHDSSKVTPVEKINELSVLDHPQILRPVDLIFDTKKELSGFTMNYISGTVPLVKLFSNAFRNKNGIETDNVVIPLVENLVEIIDFIHSKTILLVDGNENNYLVDDRTFKVPYFIDVDGYSTKTFPPTVIVLTIKDWSTKDFSRMTDWYSFAIISFMLFIGVHPYRVKPNHGADDIIKNMKKGFSILEKNPDIDLPANTRDFSNIPSEYYKWYEDLFMRGKRTPPPKVAGLLNVIQIQVRTVQSTNNFEISFIQEYGEEIVKHFYHMMNRLVKTRKQVYVNKTNYRTSSDVLAVPLNGSTNYILCKVEGTNLSLFDPINNKVVNPNIKASEIMLVNNTLYTRYFDKVFEIDLSEMNGEIKSFIKSDFDIMPNSSQLFDGVIVENIVGKTYLTIPEPILEGDSCVYNIQIKELEGYNVLEAKHDNKVCILVANKGSVYERFVIRFCNSYTKYDIRSSVTHDIDVNFVTIRAGVCVSIDESGIVEVFKNKIEDPKVTQIKDPEIKPDMRLSKEDNQVVFSRGNKLYSLKMR